jgi:hypothetical protein
MQPRPAQYRVRITSDVLPYRAGAELAVVASDSEADHRGKAIGLHRALDAVVRGRAEWIGHALPTGTEEFVILGGDGEHKTFGFSFTGTGDLTFFY